LEPTTRPQEKVKKSWVWEFYSKSGKTATCETCGVSIQQNQGSTTNLIRHLESMHSISSPKKKKSEQVRQAQIDRLVQEFICAAVVPLSIVEHPQFVNLLNFLEPQYKPPSRPNLTKLIKNTFWKHQQQVRLVSKQNN